MTWAPPGRDPIGLDAPENMTGPRMLQMTGPGAGAYLSHTALVDGRYGELPPLVVMGRSAAGVAGTVDRVGSS